MEIKLLNNGSNFTKKFIEHLVSKSIREVKLVKNYYDTKEKDILICLSDYFNYSMDEKISKYCINNNVYYLRANLIFDRAIIGPYLSNDSSCISCFYKRLLINDPEDSCIIFKDINYIEELEFNKLYSDFNFFDLVFEEIISKVKDLNKSKNLVTIVNNKTKRIRDHILYKEEDCSICNTLEKDCRERAVIKFEKRIKSSPTNYRLKLDFDISEMKRKMVDFKTGKTKHSYVEVESNYIPMVGTENLVVGDRNEGAFGRTFDYETAELSSYLEALERYSNVFNRKSNSNLFASYDEVREDAVDPNKFTLHNEKYSNKNFCLKKYNEDLKCYWIWGYSLKQKKPILIPEQMVFYKDDVYRNITNRYVFETSNGCALGATIEEAILYGLFEVIERDNFLVSWYNKLKLNEIDTSSLQENVKVLINLVESDGYELKFYDTTMELGIPSVWALLISKDNSTPVKTYSAAGCHFNPEKALISAMIEVVSSVPVYNKLFLKEEIKNRINEIYKDSDKATEFDDHVLMYAHKDALERLDFLFDNEKKELKELYKEWYFTNNFKHSDLTDDLNQLLERILKYYEDVYVIDLSGQYIDSFGVKCVKVIVPGMLTMTFGHQYRRIDENRVVNGPIIAKRTINPINISDINNYPHPFP